MRWLGISAGLAVAACTSNLHEPPLAETAQGACVALEGRTFTSLEELECGRTPEGIATCRWQLTFDIGTAAVSQFAWTYSDVSEAGQVTCVDNTITATASGRTIRGTFDPASLRLDWAGETYVAQ